ncbi:hypothetical protein HYX18_03325 [Candidatus Woesearchaeota archaeon]|nr:hypothetical protein [Candidatus Woesearchaeota archaeon]
MNLRNDKRGIELSMNVIIIAIILVIVLVIVVLFFTGGVTNAISRIKSLLGTQTIDTSTAILRCNTFCESYQNTNNIIYQRNYCGQEKFDIDTNGDGKVDRSDITCTDLGVSCSAITCGA